jgi:hypothetical protein
MHHIIAGLQIDQVGGEGGQRGLAGRGARHQFGSVEQVFAAEDGEAGIAENHPAADRSPDQINGCRRSSHVGPLGQIFGRRIGLVETELVGHAVLVEDIRHAFELACGFGKECHARTFFSQVSRFGYSHRHVAVEGHRRA